MATQKVNEPKAFPANMQANAHHSTFTFGKWKIQNYRLKRMRQKTKLPRPYFHLLRQRNL